jgi:hypothetical protein
LVFGLCIRFCFFPYCGGGIDQGPVVLRTPRHLVSEGAEFSDHRRETIQKRTIALVRGPELSFIEPVQLDLETLKVAGILRCELAAPPRAQKLTAFRRKCAPDRVRAAESAGRVVG